MASPPKNSPAATGEPQAQNPDLPPYPQMILSVIAALDEQNRGSSTRAIGRYMDQSFPNLPENHQDLLLLNLKEMKDAGQLSTAKNGYYRLPSADSPAILSTGETTPASTPGSKRGRGRPPKKGSVTPTEKGTPASDSGVKRGRGRPKGTPASTPAGTSGGSVVGKKRGRGRPAKSGGGGSSSSGKPRGRPKKVQKVTEKGKELAIVATTTEQEDPEVAYLRQRIKDMEAKVNEAVPLIRPHVNDPAALRELEDLEKVIADKAGSTLA